MRHGAPSDVLRVLDETLRTQQLGGTFVTAIFGWIHRADGRFLLGAGLPVSVTDSHLELAPATRGCSTPTASPPQPLSTASSGPSPITAAPRRMTAPSSSSASPQLVKSAALKIPLSPRSQGVVRCTLLGQAL
jgi:hypothetical protein